MLPYQKKSLVDDHIVMLKVMVMKMSGIKEHIKSLKRKSTSYNVLLNYFSVPFNRGLLIFCVQRFPFPIFEAKCASCDDLLPLA